MENSRLISRPAAYDIFSVFLEDADDGRQSAPARIAKALEGRAIEGGWPDSSFIGSERDLIAQYGVGREVMREAIRVVEARGLMRMRRGCKGGLYLVRPPLDQAAGAVATYLRSCGCSSAELAETQSIIGPILAKLPPRNLLIMLYRRTIALLDGDVSGDDRDYMRGVAVAMRLIDKNVPIPETGVDLGSEAVLSAHHSCGRATFRQALRILDDLGMLQVRRGRGGGYRLQRPQPIGVIRQLFALLASRRQDLSDVVQMTWALNVAALELSMLQLAKMGPTERSSLCNGLDAQIDHAEEPHRWLHMHEFLRETSGNKLVDILLLSVMAYQARREPGVTFSSRDEPLLVRENAMVEAMRRGDGDEAARLIRECHGLIAHLLNLPAAGPFSRETQTAKL